MPPKANSHPSATAVPARARPVVRHSLRAMLDSLGDEFRNVKGPGGLLEQDEISRLFKKTGKRHEPAPKTGVS